MTSAPDQNWNAFSPEMVEDCCAQLRQKGHLEIAGRDTPLTRVWLERREGGIVECWIAWEEE